MSKYAWATDCHLDHLGDDQQKVINFAQTLVKDNPEGIFLTGDLSSARRLIFHLSVIEKVAQRPIYFVLGNHDYYGADTAQVRKAMLELTSASQFLRYMPTMGSFGLTSTTAVIGDDGWYDGLYADPIASTFELSDWTAIGDFIPVNGNRASIVTTARKLAHDSVTHLHGAIKSAVKYHRNVVVLTHVPPFPQCHQFQGKQGDANAMPWFTSKLMGDLLLQASAAYPNTQFNVLCGHTHGRWDGRINNNLQVHVGEAEYGKPVLQGLVEVA
jgi:Icc protein